jgi:hypothetical protein
MDEDDLEGLASRLAMLASEDGEADNAGRAVGAMAHRLGLSGGELKAIFLAGVAVLRPPADGADAEPDREHLLAELALLRREVEVMQTALRRAEHERDVVRATNIALEEMLGSVRSARQVRRAIAITVVLAMLAGGAAAFLLHGPKLELASLLRLAPPVATPFGRSGVVRVASTDIHEQPDPASPVLVTLPSGSRIGVRRMVWHSLMQWAEVDVGGRTGYIVGPDIDIP